jgi:glyoxylase-like metal-dependent hydrolase (beta-lactamase superfamily II)
MIVKTVVVGDINTNCYIFGCEKTMEGAVVDPGDCVADIMQAIAQSKLHIKYIFLTHGHSDHILALGELKAATGAKVVIAEEEAPRLRRSKYMSEAVEPDVLAKDGDVFEVGTLACKWLITPGHTSGSSCILVEDVMFSGDTLFFNDCGRCDLPTGDFGAMLNSLKRLALLPGDYKVYPGHGPSSTLAFERANNQYMAQGLQRK